MTPCKFTFDDTPAFDRFAYGSKWNGFDNVAVTPQVRDQIARWFFDEYGDAGVETFDDISSLPIGDDGLVCLGWGYCTRILDVDEELARTGRG